MAASDRVTPSIGGLRFAWGENTAFVFEFFLTEETKNIFTCQVKLKTSYGVKWNKIKSK